MSRSSSARAPVVRGVAVDESGAPAAGVNVATFGGDDANAHDRCEGRVRDRRPRARSLHLMGSGNGFVAAGTTQRSRSPTRTSTACSVTVRKGVDVQGPRRAAPGLRGPRSTSTSNDARHARDADAARAGDDRRRRRVRDASRRARCPTRSRRAARAAIKAASRSTLAPDMADVSCCTSRRVRAIAGRVVDGSGKPVAAVTVMAAPRSGAERTVIVNGMVTSGAQVLTGADGKFELRGLSRRRRITLTRARSRQAAADEDRRDGRARRDRAQDRRRARGRAARRHDPRHRRRRRRPAARRCVGLGAPGHRGHASAAWARAAAIAHDHRRGDRRRHRRGSRLRAGAHRRERPLRDRGLPRAPWTVVAEAQHGALRGRQTKVTPDATITVQGARRHRAARHRARRDRACSRSSSTARRTRSAASRAPTARSRSRASIPGATRCA